MAKSRTPKGVPSGGQFSAEQHEEADVNLDKTPELCPQCGGDNSDGGGNDGLCGGCLSDEYDDDDAQAQAAELLVRVSDDAPSPALRQFPETGVITPGGVVAWRDAYNEWGRAGLEDSAPAAFEKIGEVLTHMERRASESGIATDHETFLTASEMQPESLQELADMWDSYSVVCNTEGPMRPDDWVYRHGKEFGAFRVPAPPVGTEVDEARARSLPGFTELTATFAHYPEKSFRVMARDGARWGADPDNVKMARRFTNLDTGMEVFVGGDDGAHILTATVTKHG